MAEMIQIHLERRDGLVRVVRCKDCKHYIAKPQSPKWNSTTKYCYRELKMKVDPYDFCSRGERKDEVKECI